MADREITVKMKFLTPGVAIIKDEELAQILFKMEGTFNREPSIYRLHITDFKTAVPEVKQRASRAKKTTVPFAGVEVPVTPAVKVAKDKKAPPEIANGAQSMGKDEL